MSDLLSLAPTDLTFLFEGCKTCFWNKLHGNKRPRMPFPSIFNKIDKVARQAIHMKGLEELIGLDNGYRLIDAEERTIKSEPLCTFRNNEFMISCRPDGIVYTDESHNNGIIFDMKTGTYSEEKVEIYKRQLLLGAMAWGCPARPKTKKAKVHDPKVIEKGGLMFMAPRTSRASNTIETPIEMGFEVFWVEFDLDLEEFMDWLDQNVFALYNGPEPDLNPDCVFCSHREQQKTQS